MNTIGKLFGIAAVVALIGLSFIACSNPSGSDNGGTDTSGTSGDSSPTVVSISVIPGVTPPAFGETPVTAIVGTAQFTGTVTWDPSSSTFAVDTVYTATITLTAKSGFTFQGVSKDFFTVAGTTSVNNSVNSGVVTAVFPATGSTPPAPISIKAITGVTVPVTSESPVTTIDETTQFTGTVTWGPNDTVFKASTEYTAEIHLTAKAGYTLQGVLANFFTVAGATAMSNAADSGIITAVFPATGSTEEPENLVTPYIILSAGSTFAASYNGEELGTGTIQDAVDAIQNKADGENCTIQFGNGDSDVLDIGTAGIILDNSVSTWGLITLSGSITSSINETSQGTISLIGNVSVNSTADIENTGETNSSAIYIASGGLITVSGGSITTTGMYGDAVSISSTGGKTVISGGTISSQYFAIYNKFGEEVEISGGTVTSANTAIYNNSTGKITVTGGTVSVQSAGTAIYNYSTGEVTVSGGSVSAGTNGNAILNYALGKIYVSGTALVTSQNTINTQGTIWLHAPSPDSTDIRLVISGGTIKNTYTGNNSNTIYNGSTCGITISAGTVSKSGSGYAVNSPNGIVTVTAPPAIIVGVTNP